MSYWLGVDTGGTFTDFVLLGEATPRIHKVLSTPAAPEEAILQGIREMGLEDRLRAGELVIVHGTTVATNAALESKGARTVLDGIRMDYEDGWGLCRASNTSPKLVTRYEARDEPALDAIRARFEAAIREAIDAVG